jgi:hypothetical protein
MPNKHLTFAEDTHTYFLDGQRVPGVSEVISLVNQQIYRATGQVNDEAIAKALARGTAVHSMLHNIDTKQQASGKCPDSLLRYQKAWATFKRTYGANVVDSEIRVASSRYLCAGTIDRVLDMNVNGKRALHVVDIKTGRQGETIASKLQTAAYLMMAREWVGFKLSPVRFIVHLPPEGDMLYAVHPQQSAQDEAAFLSCLAVYRWIETNKK